MFDHNQCKVVVAVTSTAVPLRELASKKRLQMGTQGGTRFLSIRGGPCQYLGSEILQQNHIWGL